MLDELKIGGYAFDSVVFMAYAQKLAIAAAILIVTWILAKAAKWAFARMVDKISFLQRDTGSGESVGMSLGKIVSLIIWLFGLIGILHTFNLDDVIAPLQTLLNSIMTVVPGIIGAAIIFFVGTIVARIVRDLVETTMATINFDKWANMGGIDAVTGNAKISKTLGTIAFVFVIIPFAIGALNVLNISSISGPATEMLNMVLKAIPTIIGASILLGIGFVIARWVGNLLEELLPDLGADRAIASLGMLPDGTSASSVISKVVMIAITIFFAIAATNLLGFQQLTQILDTVLQQGGAVVFGAVLIALGVLVGRILKNLIEGATGTGGIAPNAAYYLTVGLFVFIGLKQMAIGGPIVDYAFGSLAIGASVAFALAFGLGGRDAAAKMLANLNDKPAVTKPVAKISADIVARTAVKKAPAKSR